MGRGINGDPLKTVNGNWYVSSVQLKRPGFGRRERRRPMVMGGNPKVRSTFNYTTFVQFTKFGPFPRTCRAIYKLKNMSKPEYTTR